MSKNNTKAILQAEIAGGRILWNILRRELGRVHCGVVLARVAARLAGGAPFGQLGPAVDERDRLSRRQLGPAVNLYFVLCDELGPERALALVRNVAIDAGQVFLSKMLVLPTAPEALIAAIPGMIDSFFNAEGDSTIGTDYVEFNVTRCRFVELLDQVGAAAIKPIFCEVDRVYFLQKTVPVTLKRSTSLATGGTCCDFRFERSG